MDQAEGGMLALIGSGLSSGSGLPAGAAVSRAILARLLAPVADGARLCRMLAPSLFGGGLADRYCAFDVREVDVAFECILHGHPRPSQLRETLAKAYAGGTPNSAHRDLAALVRAGRIGNIVTTNYDQLIETALRDAGVAFDLVVNERDIVHGSTCPTVFKVHGDCLQPATIICQLGQETVLDPWKRALLDELASKSSSTRIYGYSGADFDICEVLHTSTPARPAIWHIHGSFDRISENARHAFETLSAIPGYGSLTDLFGDTPPREPPIAMDDASALPPSNRHGPADVTDEIVERIFAIDPREAILWCCDFLNERGLPAPIEELLDAQVALLEADDPRVAKLRSDCAARRGDYRSSAKQLMRLSANTADPVTATAHHLDAVLRLTTAGEARRAISCFFAVVDKRLRLGREGDDLDPALFWALRNVLMVTAESTDGITTEIEAIRGVVSGALLARSGRIRDRFFEAYSRSDLPRRVRRSADLYSAEGRFRQLCTIDGYVTEALKRHHGSRINRGSALVAARLLQEVGLFPVAWKLCAVALEHPVDADEVDIAADLVALGTRAMAQCTYAPAERRRRCDRLPAFWQSKRERAVC